MPAGEHFAKNFANMKVTSSEMPMNHIVEMNPDVNRFEKFFKPIEKKPVEEFFKMNQRGRIM